MRLAALAAAVLLLPTVADAPPRPPRTVAISVAHPTGPPDVATGFVAGDGRVVTVAHVLGGDEIVGGGEAAGGEEIAGGGAITADGAITVDGRPATVVRLDRRNDLALLRVPGIGGDAPGLGGGDDTTVLGRPAPVVRHVTARVDGGAPRPALVVRADVEAGDSGAPLVTAGGRVAGVVFARSRTRANTAYAVDAPAVAELLGRSSP
jgi:Trypsin-like peptidase domain